MYCHSDDRSILSAVRMHGAFRLATGAVGFELALGKMVENAFSHDTAGRVASAKAADLAMTAANRPVRDGSNAMTALKPLFQGNRQFARQAGHKAPSTHGLSNIYRFCYDALGTLYTGSW